MFKLADHLTADDDMHALDNIGLTFIEEYGLFAEKLELFKSSWPFKKQAFKQQFPQFLVNFSELEKKYITKKEYINETQQDDPSPSQKHLPLSHYIDLTRIDSPATEYKLTIPALKSDTLHPSPHSSTLQNSFESIALTPPPPNTPVCSPNSSANKLFL